MQDSRLPRRALPLHQDRALVGAFDDAVAAVAALRHQQAYRPPHAEESGSRRRESVRGEPFDDRIVQSERVEPSRGLPRRPADGYDGRHGDRGPRNQAACSTEDTFKSAASLSYKPGPPQPWLREQPRLKPSFRPTNGEERWTGSCSF